MFVKSGAGFQKLLDKKPLKTAVYGDSKGFKPLKRLMAALCSLIFFLLFFKDNFIRIDQAKLRLSCLLYVFFRLHVLCIFL